MLTSALLSMTDGIEVAQRAVSVCSLPEPRTGVDRPICSSRSPACAADQAQHRTRLRTIFRESGFHGRRLGRIMPVGCARAADRCKRLGPRVCNGAHAQCGCRSCWLNMMCGIMGQGTQRSLRWKSMNLQCAGGFCPRSAASPPSAGLGLISTAAAAASAADGLGAFATVADFEAGAAEAPPAVIVAATPLPGTARRHLHARQHCAYRTR